MDEGPLAASVIRALPVLPSDWTFRSHPDWDRRSSRLRCSRVGSSDPQPAPGRREGCQWWRAGWSRGPNRLLKHEQACIFWCIKYLEALVSSFYFSNGDVIWHWDAKKVNSFTFFFFHINLLYIFIYLYCKYFLLIQSHSLWLPIGTDFIYKSIFSATLLPPPLKWRHILWISF